MEDPHRVCCVPSARVNRPSLVVANDNMLVVSKSFRYGFPCKLNRGKINHQIEFCKQAIVLWCLIVETQWTLDPCCWQNQPTNTTINLTSSSVWWWKFVNYFVYWYHKKMRCDAMQCCKMVRSLIPAEWKADRISKPSLVKDGFRQLHHVLFLNLKIWDVVLNGFENLIMVERFLDPWWAQTARINRPSLVENAGWRCSYW